MPFRPFGPLPGHVRIAMVGGRETGKSSALAALVMEIEKRGLGVGGVLQPAVHEGGERIGYDLLDVADGSRFPFARKKPVVGPDELSFEFDPRGWTWARDRIREARWHADLLVVDELGKLEARGEGHMAALGAPFWSDERAPVWVLSIRDLALDPVVDRIGAMDVVVRLTGEGRDVERLIDTVLRKGPTWFRP